MTVEADNKARRADWLILALLTMAAAATRIYCMGSFPLEEGEVSSFEKGLQGVFNHKFPGTELCVIASFRLFGPSEASLRLSSVLFGILSVPAFFLAARRLFDRFAAVSGCLLIIFSAYLLDLAQLTRYYSATFFFGVIAIYLFFRFLEGGAKKHLILALLTCLLGMAFHPTFLLLPATVMACALCFLVFKPLRAGEVSFRASRVLVVLAAVLALALVPFFFPIVVGWLNRSQSLYGGWGYSPISLFLQVVKYFTIPVSATALLGLYCIFRTDRFKGFYFAFLMGLPLVTLIAASYLTDMRPDYVVFIYPAFFFAAGWFFSYVGRKTERGGLISAALLAAFIACMLPEFVSNYTGRASLDVREAVEFVKKYRRPDDQVLSFLNEFNFYAGKDFVTEPYLGATYHSGWGKKLGRYTHDPSRLWIIFKQGRGMIDPELDLWLSRYARLVKEVREKRFDYTFRTIRVFLKD